MGTGETDGLTREWALFNDACGTQLEAWLEAERAVAEARARGIDDPDAGDRLMASEAALQTAIIDFAASQPGVENPTPLALGILRLAEARLAGDPG